MPDRYGNPDDEIPAQRDDPLAVVHCELCDDDGMRGMHRCDHIDYAAIAKRHRPRITEILEKKQQQEKGTK